MMTVEEMVDNLFIALKMGNWHYVDTMEIHLGDECGTHIHLDNTHWEDLR